MRRLQSLGIWLCVGLYLSLSVGVSGLVLCVGKEGHVAIESQFAEDCCDDQRGPSDGVRLVATDACGCTDGSILPAAAAPVPRGDDHLQPALVLRSVVARPAEAPLASTFERLLAAASGSPPLRSLATVVLVV